MERNIQITVAALLALMVCVGVVFLFVVAPKLGEQTVGMMRDDVVHELESLRMLERNLQAFDKHYLPCGSREAAEALRVADGTGVGADECWSKLGFKVERRAVYWVESDGASMTAYARFDLDNDGKVGEAHVGPTGDAVVDGF